jgi:hypothetical protein
LVEFSKAAVVASKSDGTPIKKMATVRKCFVFIVQILPFACARTSGAGGMFAVLLIGTCEA